MKTEGNTVLITGGATGIGFSLAEAFVMADNEVIICGRRENRLREARDKLPRIHISVCDLSKDKERKSLFDWVNSNFSHTNILINNAGIQRMIDFNEGTKDLFDGEDEIEVNLKATVHLSAYFVPLLSKHKEAAIINISSGLAFIPLAAMPIYCATKAAIHSFSLSLRHQLRDTSIKVFEIMPPMVDTELDKGTRGERGQEDRGIPPAEVARATIKALGNNEYEVAVGMAQNLRTGARNNPEQLFQNMNQW